MNLKEQKEEEIWDAAPSVLNVNLCLNNFVTFGKFFAHLQFLLLKYVHMVWLPILLSSLQFPDKNVLTFKLNINLFDLATYSLSLLRIDGACLCVSGLRNLQCFKLCEGRIKK